MSVCKKQSELLKIKERDGEIEISNKNASVFSVALPAYCGIIKKSKGITDAQKRQISKRVD